MGSYKTNVFACWKDHLLVLHSNAAGSTLIWTVIWTGILDSHIDRCSLLLDHLDLWDLLPLSLPNCGSCAFLATRNLSKALNAQWLVSLFTTLPGPSAPSYHQLRSNTSSLPRSPELPAIMTAQLSSRAPLYVWKTSYKCLKFYSCLMVVIAFQLSLRW